MENTYRFTIITVCYNAGDSIDKTIDSVIKQDCDSFEYLLIDGKSSDNTVDVIKSYQEKNEKKIRWVSEPDNGLYDAMNKGIKLSKGQYLVFINADDEMCPHSLAYIDNILKSSDVLPEIIYGDSIVVYRDGENETRKLRKAYPNITKKTLGKGMGVVHQSMFTRRDVFDRVGCFDTRYSIGADWNFLIQCVLNNTSMQYVDRPVSIFATDGMSSKVHNIQRHIIRKNNKLYRFFDFNLLRDVLNIGVMIQLVIGEENYRKLRYAINKKRT